MFSKNQPLRSVNAVEGNLTLALYFFVFYTSFAGQLKHGLIIQIYESLNRKKCEI